MNFSIYSFKLIADYCLGLVNGEWLILGNWNLLILSLPSLHNRVVAIINIIMPI